MKKILFLFFLITILCAQPFKLGQAKGLFMGVGIGQAIPIGDFSTTHNIGICGQISFSYTDNLLLPVFYYLEIGFQHNPGGQNFYQKSDYAAISTNLISFCPGARFYFSPIFENVVILMPVIEAGFTYGYVETLNQFKSGSGKSNYTKEVSKYCFHIGGGIYMFLLDVMLNYAYLKNYQSISFVMKIRIPIFMKM
jgi:hypothetical protein